jgi:hypothetical protein
VDTYLRFAEAVNRLDLMSTETQGLPELMEGITEGGASNKTKGMLQGAKEALFGDEDDEDEEKSTSSSSRKRSSSGTTRRRRRTSSGGNSGSRSRSSSRSSS